MKHVLEPEHQAHLRSIGLADIPDLVHVSAEEYARDYALWRQTLPEASDQELHKRVLGHAATRAASRSAALARPVDNVERLDRVDAGAGPQPEIWFWRLFAAVILIVLLLFVGPCRAHAQFSKINSIQFQNNDGSSVTNGFFSYPFAIRCGSNMTCTVSGSVLNMSASSTASTAWSSLTNGTNSNAGTFAASGNTWDFTASSLFKLRVGAALTTSANGDTGYDSTGKIWHIWQNGGDKFSIAASNLGNSGQPCLSNGDGSCTFADPIVSGPDAPGVAPTKNPVQIGAIGADGNVHRVVSDNNGNLGVQFPSAQPVTQSGTWTVQPGNTANTTPWLATINQGGNSATVTAANALKVDGSAVTQPVSGTVTANQGGTWTVQPGNTANTTPWLATINQGGNSATVTAANALKVDGSAVTQPVSGTVSANQGGTWTVQPGNTANTTPWLATINQGGNSATVTAANALKVDGSAVTQPISAASLPLPANGAQETGGNLATLAGGVTSSVYQANIKQVGGTAVVADPCQANAKSYVSINQTANAQLVTGTASKKIYPCSINLVTATAQNIALVEGTGTTCGTGTSGVPGFGGATAATGWNLAANGGLTYGNGAAALGQEANAADNLCLFQSGTGQVSGGLSYVVQ